MTYEVVIVEGVKMLVINSNAITMTMNVRINLRLCHIGPSLSYVKVHAAREEGEPGEEMLPAVRQALH